MNLTMSDRAKVFEQEPHVRMSCVTSGSVVSESAASEIEMVSISTYERYIYKHYVNGDNWNI